jgi:deoxyhypusine synthase
MIYTNNTGAREWAHHIISYFESKIKYKLIDQLIAAFKINGKQVEICRTTHNKTHNDLIRCTKIPASAEICFLDDTFYHEMANENIYYINIKPYYYDLKFNEMIHKFKNSVCGKKLINDDDSFEKIMNAEFKRYNYECLDKNLKEYEIDKVLGKQIMTHLQEFFNNSSKNKTRRNTIKKNKTRRKY